MIGLVWAGLLACSGPATPIHTDDPGDTAPPPLSCPNFAAPESLGTVPSPPATELSGIVVDAQGVWVHNDSGTETLYRLGLDATLLGDASTGMLGRDLEDLARTPDGTLVLADIGDNGAARPDVSLVELTLDGFEVSAIERQVLVYEDGPRDAETLWVDDDGTVWVVSKELDGASGVYAVVDGVLERRSVLQFGTAPLGQATLVTGGDLGPRGIVLRTYLDEAYVWPRTPGEPVEQTLARSPCPVPIAGEPQGEAIAWGPDGLYTVSEGTTPTLYRIPFDESPP